MATLEELMAGLFGSNVAPGAEDPRRRRAGGAAGGAALFNDFLPFLKGLPSYDYTGPGRGLVDLLSGAVGPAARHFQRQGAELPPGLAGQDALPPGLAGQDQLPPGLDNRNPLGGPNAAPGNIDSGRAVYQAGMGRALGQAQVPRTQGWLNVAPGYAVAASQGFGSKDFGGRGQAVEQQGGVGGPGGGGRVGGGGAPPSQNAIGGGGPRVAPATGAGGTTGGGGGGGKQTGGGGAPAGVTPQVKAQSAQQSTARGGVELGKGGGALGLPDNAGGVKGAKPKVNKAYDVIQAGGNPFVDTINIVPNAGNNNTPSEVGEQGKLAGLTPQEKAKRKAAWEQKVAAKQERARVKAAPSASNFGEDPRGTGTAPLPKKGKTKPKSGRPSGYVRGQR